MANDQGLRPTPPGSTRGRIGTSPESPTWAIFIFLAVWVGAVVFFGLVFAGVIS